MHRRQMVRYAPGYRPPSHYSQSIIPAMHPYTHPAVSAARRAGGGILQYYRRGETGDVQRKAEDDYVTEADQRAEEVIIDSIQRAYPEHAIRAEESGRRGGSRQVEYIAQ